MRNDVSFIHEKPGLTQWSTAFGEVQLVEKGLMLIAHEEGVQYQGGTDALRDVWRPGHSERFQRYAPVLPFPARCLCATPAPCKYLA